MNKLAGLLLVGALWCGASSPAAAQVYVTYYQPAPACAPPAAYATYYAPAPVVYQPVARATTRYRPLLGGSVTRVRYGYAPVVYGY
jgi:hypothetical protein